VDGAGRLVQVIEDPAGLALESDYQYDAAGNLLCVEQHGGVTGTGCSSNPSNDSTSAWRVRRFTYDDVSRLLTAKNPESGTIAYTYDADGNVVTKTDARGITTCFGDWSSSTCNGATGYDVLNRLLKKTYSDGSTPTVQFGYDGVALTGCTIAAPGDTDTYPTGRRTSMCDGSGGTSWVHDPMGRVKQERRAIGTLTVSHYIDYTYNPDGSLKVLQTPPMKQLNYTFDMAGRPTQLVDSTDNINFALSATYAPAGELAGATLGSATGFNGFTVSNAYNNRLQPALLSASSPSATVFSDSFDFHLGAGDNGNVFKITNNRDSTHGRDQNFLYDSLNRIQQAYSSGSGTFSWGETFSPTATSPGVAPTTPGIDAWGNLTNRSGVTGKTYAEPLNCPANTNNQLTACSNPYDAAGNMTGYAAASYVYDAENRLVWTSGDRYIYDGNGQRVQKCQAASATTACPTTGTTGTLYWRGTGSETLAETDLAGNDQEEYIFFNGQRIARRDTTSTGTTIAIHYYFSDHLGTHGVVENATGTVCEQDMDYYPYGGVENDYCSSTSVPQNYKFTGKERDGESGLDYFGARHNAPTMGRFMTPDLLLNSGQPWNPQSWNRYAYTENNPLRYTDPTGLYKFGKCSGTEDQCKADEQRFRDSIAKAKEALKGLDPNSKEAKELKKTIDKLGDEGKGNIKINFGDAGKKDGQPNLGRTLGNSITINYAAVDEVEKDFSLNASESAALDAGVTTHEGTHAGGGPSILGLLGERGEHAAYFTESVTYQGLRNTDQTLNLWNESWLAADNDKLSIERNREESIQNAIHPPKQEKPQ